MKSIITCIFLIFLFSNSEIMEVKKSKIEDKKPFLPSLKNVQLKKGMTNELYILHPAFRNKVIRMIYKCKKQGIDLIVVETYRTPGRQDSLKRRKRSMLSGGYSKHQHFIAIDIVPIKNGKAIWYNKRLWNQIGKIGEAEGLLWGGRWVKLKDNGHFEYPISIDSTKSLSLPDTVLIPLN